MNRRKNRSFERPNSAISQHPVKPAFDTAHDDREAWRQQELARLNDQQREQYDAMVASQQQVLEGKANELQECLKDDVADSMRKHLTPLGQPRHDMSGGPHNSPHLHDLKRAQESVDDHLKGKDTPETERYAGLLNDAQGKAQKQVAHEHQQTLQNHENKQQNDRDRFLGKAENERLTEKQQEVAEQFQEAARDAKQERTSDRFNEAAQDKSLQEAIEKAAEQEADRGLEHGHDLENDPDHQR